MQNFTTFASADSTLPRESFCRRGRHLDREAVYLRVWPGNYREVPTVLELASASYEQAGLLMLASDRLCRVRKNLVRTRRRRIALGRRCSEPDRLRRWPVRRQQKFDWRYSPMKFCWRSQIAARKPPQKSGDDDSGMIVPEDDSSVDSTELLPPGQDAMIHDSDELALPPPS